MVITVVSTREADDDFQQPIRGCQEFEQFGDRQVTVLAFPLGRSWVVLHGSVLIDPGTPVRMDGIRCLTRLFGWPYNAVAGNLACTSIGTNFIYRSI